MTTNKGIYQRLLYYGLLLIGIVLILFPFYITIITALKTQAESAQNFFALPQTLNFANFTSVFSRANYLTYFSNSTIVTVCSMAFIYLLTPICAYAISRSMSRGRYFKIIYIIILSGIFVPFQVVMIPMVKHLSSLGLLNRVGLIIMHVTFASSQAIFLLVSYIKSIPPDLEEAAVIAGSTTFGTYWRVVLPLITPMTVTVIVLNALWVWNDFQMPLLILNASSKMWTLPLFQFNFKSEYSYDYNMAFASYLITMVPVLVIYAFAQKYIVSGLTQGAVKS